MKNKSSIMNVVDGIWKDRQLLLELTYKDFQRKFSGTYLGIFWALAQPALTIVVYCIAFQYGFKSGPINGTPYVVWFVCGIVPWLFVTEAFSTASNCFVEYSYLIKKVKFNTNILPLVKILSSFYIHLLFCVLAVIVALIFAITPTVYIIQLLYYMIANVCFLFAISLITSTIVVFVRDLNQMISVILLIGMWATPIAWSLDSFSQNVQLLFQLNPFLYIIEGYRDAILARGWFWEKTELTIYFWIVVLSLIVLGGWLYTKLRPHFADTV